jgi:hydrogenase maturation protease
MKHGRILVAGIGNIFLGDDAFGVVVARRLRELVHDVRVVVEDFGIRGLDLAFALQEGYDAVVLVDATRQGGVPGTLYLIAPEGPGDPLAGEGMDPHGLSPAGVLGLARALGECPCLVRVVGCEPANLEPEEGLSPPIAAAVSPAVERIQRLVAELLGEAATRSESQREDL